MKKNKDVEVIVDKCIKNKIILGKELIGLHYNYYFVQIAEAFEKYSDEVIKSYLINCIQQGKDKKELKFPRDNRAECIVTYIFGKNFRQEIYRKDYVLAICCQKVFKNFIRENSWEVLFAKKILDISNCGYDNIRLSVETLSYIDDCFEKKRPLGNIYDTYNIKKKSSRYNFLNNSIIPLKTYDQWIEYISGYIKKRAEKGKVFNGDRTIVEELFGEEIYSNYMRLNVSCKADFHTIIEQSKKEITEKFYFFPEKIHEEAINNIKNRRALLSIIAEIPKYSPAVNYIFYVEKYIIPKVGEEEFKLYLDDMIEKELIKGNNKILEVSYNILGFPANSFNHIGRHKKLEQLFYFRWMHHVPMHYNGDSSIEKMLKKSGFSEEQKKDWFISRYGTRAKFMDATWKDVEIICNQIIMDFLNEGKILNRGYFYARLLQINDKDILANYNLSKINHYDKIEKLLAFNIRCYEERLKQRNKVLISKRMNEIRIYYKKHNSYNSCCLKFYKIQSDQIREILMDYLEKNYIEYDDNSIMNLTADLRRTIEIIQVIQNKFKIELISDITTHMIAFSFHYMEFEQGLKPITIKGKHWIVNSFLDNFFKGISFPIFTWCHII